MHDDVAGELVRQQRHLIAKSLEQQEREYQAKGFTFMTGLPFVVNIMLDAFQNPSVMDCFISPLKALGNLSELLREAVAAEFPIPLGQILVDFVIKTNCDYYKLFSPEIPTKVCTLIGAITAVSKPVYHVMATTFKCTNCHCLRRDLTIVHQSNGVSMSEDGERLFVQDNVHVCSGCRMQMTEMTHARVFHKTINVKMSLNSRFVPVDVVLESLDGRGMDVQLGEVVVIHGHQWPLVVNHNWQYSFKGLLVERQPENRAIRPSDTTQELALSINRAIASYGTERPLITNYQTDADISSLKIAIEHLCTANDCQVIRHPQNRQYTHKQRNDHVEGGRLQFTCSASPKHQRYLVLLLKESKEVPFIVAQCRAERIPVVIVGDYDTDDADQVMSIDMETLIDTILGSTNNGVNIRMPPSPAPSTPSTK